MGTLQAKAIVSGVVLLVFLRTDSLAQNKPIQRVEWEKIRSAFSAYCTSPSADSAQRVISVLPSSFDNRGISQEELDQWSQTSRYINGNAYRVLDKLLQSGDRYAIRIVLRTLVISDGGYAEELCGLASKSVASNPIGFLEELKACITETDLGDVAISTVVPPYLDGDNIEKRNREIQSRIDLLKTISRPDLAEVQDKCLGTLKEALRNIGEP